MTVPEKPEWIKIADKDRSDFPPKVSKGLPVMAFVVTASIIGFGSIFAQSVEKSPADSVEMTSSVVQSTQSTEPSSTTISTPPFATQTSNAPNAATTSNITFTMKNPSIGTLPTGGGDDDDDTYEGEDDEYEGEDD